MSMFFRIRSQKVLFWISTLLIVLISGIFLWKNFTGNPLAGRWVSEDEKYYLEIKKDKKALAGVIGEEDGEMALSYTIYKREKVVIFSAGSAIGQLTEGDTDIDTEAPETYFSRLQSGFDYSIDKNRLTLSEREYGFQMNYVKE